jgi:hypothetical protein
MSFEDTRKVRTWLRDHNFDDLAETLNNHHAQLREILVDAKELQDEWRILQDNSDSLEDYYHWATSAAAFILTLPSMLKE